MQIDKAKLLEWLEEIKEKQERDRDRLDIGNHYWEYHEGASDYLDVVIRRIKTGEFDIKEVPHDK